MNLLISIFFPISLLAGWLYQSLNWLRFYLGGKVLEVKQKVLAFYGELQEMDSVISIKDGFVFISDFSELVSFKFELV